MGKIDWNSKQISGKADARCIGEAMAKLCCCGDTEKCSLGKGKIKGGAVYQQFKSFAM